VAWRSFLAFCSARQLELENVKAYHVGAWLDQHPGSRSTQRQHLVAVRLLFDSLMMRGVVEYNPAARARPPRLVRESSHTPVFEEAEIVAFLDSINLESLKDIRDKAIFSVLFYSWCRVSALINLSVADYYERGGTRWLRFKKNEEKNTKSRCIRRLKKRSMFGLNALAWLQIQVLPCFLPLPRIVKRLNRDAWIVGVS
jgi:integrase/recombinase XerD